MTDSTSPSRPAESVETLRAKYEFAHAELSTCRVLYKHALEDRDALYKARAEHADWESDCQQLKKYLPVPPHWLGCLWRLVDWAERRSAEDRVAIEQELEDVRVSLRSIATSMDYWERRLDKASIQLMRALNPK